LSLLCQNDKFILGFFSRVFGINVALIQFGRSKAMEQYQIRLNENLTIENLFDKLSLRSWTMIQQDLKSSKLTIQSYRKLSEKIRECLECHIDRYDACGTSCLCNETTLFKPLSANWDPDFIESTDNIYQLFVETTFNQFIDEIADTLTTTLATEISFGRRDKVQTKLATVVKCVLADHIYWNSLCRVSKRAVCQPSCCSLMI
jgi:hypothetical protein